MLSAAMSIVGPFCLLRLGTLPSSASGVAVSAPAIQPAIIEAASKFIGMAFFFVPLQVGAAEGSYVVIFGALGLPVAAGFSLAFVRRLRSLLVASAGLAALNVLTRRKVGA